MKKETALPVRSHAKNIVFSAVFAALCCVGTLVIIIPLPYGYFNAGDIFVLLAGWCLGVFCRQGRREPVFFTD